MAINCFSAATFYFQKLQPQKFHLIYYYPVPNVDSFNVLSKLKVGFFVWINATINIAQPFELIIIFNNCFASKTCNTYATYNIYIFHTYISLC